MIDIAHLTKRFGDVLALDDVSFGVTPGTIVGFLGPNGAGKSTCLKTLVGLVRADAGAATIGGRTYADHPTPALVAGSLLGTEAFHPGRTGRETLTGTFADIDASGALVLRTAKGPVAVAAADIYF